MAGKRAGTADSYHHGNLRAELLRAGEAELEERGVEGFSLRRVALRAHVSHAAPAHHFGDAGGLLTALAAVGFDRFISAQLARQRKADDAPLEQLVAAGLGYVDFACGNPGLFRLMFSSGRPDHSDEDLKRAATAAYEKLVGEVARVKPGAAAQDADVTATWALVHGVADLLMSGRLKSLQKLGKAKREAEIASMLRDKLRCGLNVAS